MCHLIKQLMTFHFGGHRFINPLEVITHSVHLMKSHLLYSVILKYKVSLVEKELLSLPGRLISSPVLSGVLVALFSVFCVIFCRSMSVLFFSLPLHYLSFDLRILITTLVSSNFSTSQENCIPTIKAVNINLAKNTKKQLHTNTCTCILLSYIYMNDKRSPFIYHYNKTSSIKG